MKGMEGGRRRRIQARMNEEDNKKENIKEDKKKCGSNIGK
jgi:hypothetical protein